MSGAASVPAVDCKAGVNVRDGAAALKIAVVSKALPLAESGQSRVLQLLCGALPDCACWFLSCETEARHWEAMDGQPFGSVRLAARPRGWAWVRTLPLLGRLLAWGLTVATLLRRARQIARALRHMDASVVVACTGDLLDIPAAALAARHAGVPLLLYLFDDYQYQWMGLQRTAAAWFERMAIRAAAGAIAPNELLAAAYRERHGISVAIVRNPVHPAAMSAPAEPARRTWPVASLVYTGSIYHAHFDAFARLVAALQSLEGRAALHIYTSQLAAVLREHGIAGPVHHHSYVEPADVFQVQRAADILFLPLAFASKIPEVVRTSAPGKLGEYLAAGRPILVHAPADAFVSRFLRERGCGFVVDRPDVGALREAVLYLLDDPAHGALLAQRAREVAREFALPQAVAALRGALLAALLPHPR